MTDQCDLVDNWSSRGIDQEGILLHLVQPVSIDEVLCLLVQITVKADNLQRGPVILLVLFLAVPPVYKRYTTPSTLNKRLVGHRVHKTCHSGW